MPQVTENTDFLLHGIMQLQKSVDSEKDVANGTAERRLVYGEISNENKDEEGENLIQKSLDWSYFDQQGCIKYEHVKDNPEHVIGFPHERLTKGGRTIVKGAILKGTKFSDATWTLIKAVEEHNKQFPDNPKTLGWSIEGSYTDGRAAKGGVRKAKVINVVITPNPVNKSVWLKTMEANHKLFAKSISGGEGAAEAMVALKAMAVGDPSTDVSQKTGVDAISKENIDEDLKGTAEGSEPKKRKLKRKVKKGVTDMKTFTTVEDATAHFASKGIADEDALELAKSLFPDSDDSQGESNAGDGNEGEIISEVSKGFADLKEMFKGIFNREDAGYDDGDDDGIEADDGGDDDGIYDAGPILMSINKSISDTHDLLEQKVQYDVQRDEMLVKALAETDAVKAELEVVKSLLVVGEGKNQISLSKGIQILLTKGSGPVRDLASYNPAPEGGEGAGDAKTVSKSAAMKFGVLSTELQKGVDAEKITLVEKSTAETAHRIREYGTSDAILARAQA
jgi:hypothetical protein